MKKFHSKVLNLHYIKDQHGGITFEDDIKYNQKELKLITESECNDEQKRTIHKVKKIFPGQIIDYTKKETYWRGAVLDTLKPRDN